jgi:hypothetical protein
MVKTSRNLLKHGDVMQTPSKQDGKCYATRQAYNYIMLPEAILKLKYNVRGMNFPRWVNKNTVLWEPRSGSLVER